jgi:hypothetical protein
MRKYLSLICVAVVLCLFTGCPKSDQVTKSDLDRLMTKSDERLAQLVTWTHDHAKVEQAQNKITGEIDEEQKAQYKRLGDHDRRLNKLEEYVWPTSGSSTPASSSRPVAPGPATPSVTPPPATPPASATPVTPPGATEPATEPVEEPVEPAGVVPAEPSPSDLPVPDAYVAAEEPSAVPEEGESTDDALASAEAPEEPPRDEPSASPTPPSGPRFLVEVHHHRHGDRAKDELWEQRYQEMNGEVVAIKEEVGVVKGHVARVDKRVGKVERNISGFQEEVRGRMDAQDKAQAETNRRLDETDKKLDTLVESVGKIAAGMEKPKATPTPAPTHNTGITPGTRYYPRLGRCR